MLTRRHALLLAAALALTPSVGFAAPIRQFASANFQEAKTSGKPVLIHIDASWCPTCRAQKPIIDKLLASDRYKGFAAFSVDYDSEKPVMRTLNAPDRSTIIVFKGGREIARSVGDTGEPAIQSLLDKAL